MDLSKSYDFFKPEQLEERVHIVGLGAVGSTIAEVLARFGVTKMTLYDFDIVEPHNIANQMFRDTDIGKTKVDAVADILEEINPDIRKDLKLVTKGWTGQKLAGYVFLAVDNIDTRREITKKCQENGYVKAMFDVRLDFTTGQSYAADFSKTAEIENFLKTMDFSHEEAKQNEVVNACNLTLSIVPTVRTICSLCVSNFINFVQGKGLKKLILSDPFKLDMMAI